jgi:hypothetical protein
MASDRLLQIEQSRRLIERLERLSADSYWAHQASGVRGALLRKVEQLQPGDYPGSKGEPDSGRKDLEKLVQQGYFILEQAARELERRI